MAEWTQEEAVAYECARETITHLMAIQTSQIAEETGKPNPDAERVASLRAERSRLALERASLHVGDHAHVARISKEYGAIIRVHRST